METKEVKTTQNVKTVDKNNIHAPQKTVTQTKINNKPIKKSCFNLMIFEIIICDLVTLAFSIVIFVKADKTLTPKEGEGFIAIFKLIIFLFYLVPSIG